MWFCCESRWRGSDRFEHSLSPPLRPGLHQAARGTLQFLNCIIRRDLLLLQFHGCNVYKLSPFCRILTPKPEILYFASSNGTRIYSPQTHTRNNMDQAEHTSGLMMLADAAIARAEAERPTENQNTSVRPMEQDTNDQQPATILTRIRNIKIDATTTKAFVGSTKTGSGFASLTANGGDEESCWSKAARKNRDKGHKTWQTFNILHPRQDTAARVSKPVAAQAQQQARKPSKKQAERMAGWMKGYHEAEDKYCYIHGLRKIGETESEVLGINFDQNVGMKGEVEMAEEFEGWEEWQDWEGGWVEEWRENYDDENPFLNK